MTTTQNETQTMTEAQATDETMLLLTRKLRRLHPAAFADVLARLPRDARTAITLAENRADLHRESVGGPSKIEWPADAFADDETE